MVQRTQADWSAWPAFFPPRSNSNEFHAAVHSYIYEALLQLVLIHSQVTSVAKSLVNRVLATIVNEMATESLRCFEQVERFGLGGMLQVLVLPLLQSSPLKPSIAGDTGNRVHAPNDQPIRLTRG